MVPRPAVSKVFSSALRNLSRRQIEQKSVAKNLRQVRTTNAASMMRLTPHLFGLTTHWDQASRLRGPREAACGLASDYVWTKGPNIVKNAGGKKQPRLRMFKLLVV